MAVRIWKSWLVSVLSADIIGAIALYVFVMPEISELFWYVIRGLLFVTFTVPIPIILQLLDLTNADLEDADRYDKVKIYHFIVTVILMIIEAIFTANFLGGPTSWGDFSEVIFVGVLLIYFVYGISSAIVWRILNKDITSV